MKRPCKSIHTQENDYNRAFHMTLKNLTKWFMSTFKHKH